MGDPVVGDWNPAADAARLLRLAEWCGRFAPSVGVSSDADGWEKGNEPPGLFLDLGGCADLLEHRYGAGELLRNEQRLATEIEASLDRLGFTAFTAVADTVGIAWGLARCRAARHGAPDPDAPEDRPLDRIARPGTAREVLERLPIETLRFDAETRDGLRQLHFERGGDLLAIDRCELGLRFGAAVPRRLAQALGEIEEAVVAVRTSPALEVERAFTTPVQAREGVELAVGGMLGDLCDRLRRAERGVERIGLRMERLDREPASLVLTLGRASRRTGHLWSLLSQRLEEIDLGLGIERIELRALRVRALPHRQPSLHGTGRSGDANSPSDIGHGDEAEPVHGEATASELADAIVSRWGDHALQAAEPIEAHAPEAGDRLAPGHSEPKQGGRSGSAASRWPRGLRPTLLRRRPDPVRIERPLGEPDSTPDRLDVVEHLAIRWLDRSRTVIAAYGPERIAEPWWRRDDAVPGEATLPQIREYWRCLLEGGLWVWVFREVRPARLDAASSPPRISAGEDDRWFLHGIWA